MIYAQNLCRLEINNIYNFSIKAITHFSRSMGYNYLGKCMMKMKNYNIALSYFDSAINLNPKDPTSYNNRGLCKTMLKFESIEAEALTKGKRHSDGVINISQSQESTKSPKKRKKKS